MPTPVVDSPPSAALAAIVFPAVVSPEASLVLTTASRRLAEIETLLRTAAEQL